MTGFLIHHLKPFCLTFFRNVRLWNVCLTEICFDSTDSSLLWKSFSPFPSKGVIWMLESTAALFSASAEGKMKHLWIVMVLVSVCTEVTWLMYRFTVFSLFVHHHCSIFWYAVSQAWNLFPEYTTCKQNLNAKPYYGLTTKNHKPWDLLFFSSVKPTAFVLVPFPAQKLAFLC